MAISVTAPVDEAIQHTKKVLFQHFSLGKWFVMGFCAFLANLGQGGGGGPRFNMNFPRGGGGPSSAIGPSNDVQMALGWLKDNLSMVIVIGLLIVLVIIALGLLLCWLSSRGKFMFLYCVVNNVGAVKAPWHKFKALANSLFWWRILFGLATSLVSLIILGIGALIALPDISAWTFSGHAIAAIITVALILLPYGIALACVALFVRDFLVPIMYMKELRIMDAWRDFGTIFWPNKWRFVLYILFNIVIVICVGILMIIAMCLTCCIAALPYIGTVILLPFLVFLQSYPLFFLEQFGTSYESITRLSREMRVLLE